MAKLSPDTLRKAANLKSALTTPTAEGVKGTTAQVAKGAVQGAATGGWVGAARGAAVSFAQTRAGRRLIAVVLGLVLVLVAAVPVTVLAATLLTGAALAGGDAARTGQSVNSDGVSADELNAAVALAEGADFPWEIYLAIKQTTGEADPARLEPALDGLTTLGAGAVYIEGKGMVPGPSDAAKELAAHEREQFIAALTDYGLDEPTAGRVYDLALKWRLGQVDQCGAGERVVGDVELAVGDSAVTLTEVQARNAQRIIAAARSIDGMTDEALIIALMAALTESRLLNYANESVPESLEFAHDAVGSDHDSLGFWQMRAGWGSVADRMNLAYQVKAFFGGPGGPNGGSPAGLFDIPGWEQMPKAEAAQAVEVSAHPDRYAAEEPLARAILERFSGAGTATCDGGLSWAGTAGHPLGDPGWPISFGFGNRDAVCGGVVSCSHRGIDFRGGADVCNRPIYAVADGEVVVASWQPVYGWTVIVDHGNGLKTLYAHMPPSVQNILPDVGERVATGQQVGVIGTSGNSTGCHLHFGVMANGVFIDPAPVLVSMGVELTWLPNATGKIPGAVIRSWGP